MFSIYFHEIEECSDTKITNLIQRPQAKSTGYFRIDPRRIKGFCMVEDSVCEEQHSCAESACPCAYYQLLNDA